jgi:competence protein ComFC
MAIKKIGKFFIGIIFPKECVNCGNSGKWICFDCFNLIDFKPLNLCIFCEGFSFLGLTCRKCKKDNYLDGAFSFNSYNNIILKKIIHNYKYNNVKSFSNNLSSILTIVLKNIEKAQAINVIPCIIDKNTLFFSIPLHKRRLRYRGFNQVELLLDNLVLKDVVSLGKVGRGLVRGKYTKPQVKVENKKERLKNLQGVFNYSGKSIKGRKIILIDDVSTTGATFNECAKVLKSSGAKKVYGVSIARG